MEVFLKKDIQHPQFFCGKGTKAIFKKETQYWFFPYRDFSYLPDELAGQLGTGFFATIEFIESNPDWFEIIPQEAEKQKCEYRKGTGYVYSFAPIVGKKYKYTCLHNGMTLGPPVDWEGGVD